MNLFEAMNLEYSVSKWWLSTSLGLTCLFYGCLILTAAASGPWLKRAAFIAFLVQVLTPAARMRSATLYTLAESVRRAAMLQNGLGTRISPLQVAKIAAKHGITFRNETATFDRYYESALPAGPRRLLEITEESAFWTSELAERMAVLLKVVLVIVLALVIIAALVALQSGLTKTQGELFAKIFMGTLTVWCTGDLFTLWRRYDSLAHGAQRVLTDCERMKSISEIGHEAVVAFGEYNCFLAAAPVIPEFIYKLSQKKLNAAWASRNAQEPTKV